MILSIPRIIHWAPRILGVAYVLFLSVFALDVFEEHLGIGRTILALGMHLIPAGVMLLAIAVGWRWPAIGGGIFVTAAILYGLSVWRSHPSWFLVIGVPSLITGGLFLADYFLRAFGGHGGAPLRSSHR